MSWIDSVVRPKFRKLVSRTEVPDNTWNRCSSCNQMILQRDLEKQLYVCQFCDHHMRLGVKERLSSIFDAGKYETIDLPAVAVDPLKFRDKKKYTDRIKEYQNKAATKEALAVGFGSLGGNPLVVAAFDFSFMGGSMGVAVGEGLLAAAERAVKENAPLLAIPASGGARMQEGILSLMQLPRSILAVDMVREAKLPYVVLLTDPTTGGVTASFAMLGDIHISEPGTTIGFAGKRVIEETIREKLPEDFQTAEYLEKHGIVDMVVHRRDMRESLIRVFDLVRNKFKNDVLAVHAKSERRT
ncbi:MAG: acetyl-CoA carboxylase, carboxyltransferase subunit beta [Alphaproteobacteria bacterium]